MHINQNTMNKTLRRVFMRLHFPIEVIPTCVRWCVAYSLSLRQLQEMMAEPGVAVDHLTLHRWAIKLFPYWWPRVVDANDLSASAGAWTRPASKSQANGNGCTGQ